VPYVEVLRVFQRLAELAILHHLGREGGRVGGRETKLEKVRHKFFLS